MRLGKHSCMLSYWLVDSYNPTNNSIHVNGKTFVFTRETIRDIYGIPMGEIVMSNPVKANHEDDVILNDSDAGPLFMMNFLVLYVFVMIGFPSMGTVNQSFLTNIKMDVDISRLDWCGLVLTCLNASRSTWNRLDEKCVFTGPVAFLLLHTFMFYHSQTACVNQPSPRGSDGIKGDPKDIDGETNKISDHTNLEINVYRFVTSNCVRQPINKSRYITLFQGLLHMLDQTFTTYYKAKEDLDVLLEIAYMIPLVMKQSSAFCFFNNHRRWGISTSNVRMIFERRRHEMLVAYRNYIR
ncbi:hypothetical protein LXL04_002745 [Taraxacum kok-saghyz]